MLINFKKKKGSVLIETIVATGLFVIMSTFILVNLIDTREYQYNSYLYNQGASLAKEWMEALISIKTVGSDSGSWNNQNGFDTMTVGTHYLSRNGEDHWELESIAPEIINGKFYRTIFIEDVDRLDWGRGDIDTTGTGTGEGLLYSGVVTKKVTVQVEWQKIDQTTWQVAMKTYLINWGNPLIFAN